MSEVDFTVALYQWFCLIAVLAVPKLDHSLLYRNENQIKPGIHYSFSRPQYLDTFIITISNT